jgi:hypothetical protein
MFLGVPSMFPVSWMAAVLLLLISAGSAGLMYKLWLAMLPFLEPLQLKLNNRNRDRKSQ